MTVVGTDPRPDRHERHLDLGDRPFRLRDRAAREREERGLAPGATRSTASAGRARPEEPDALRTAFEVDRDRILSSKALRRLRHKTQVFLDPEGDHVVTRLTHTTAVTAIARAIAAGLGLNTDLAEAIALGHDVGHSPFGHAGETALDPWFPDDGWHHAAQGVRVLSVLEDLNLSAEVLDGIRAHSWKIDPPPGTPEAFCVRYADRIAYLTHDALDCVRYGLITPDEVPAGFRERFGPPSAAWHDRLVEAVVDGSLAAGTLTMDRGSLDAMHELRDFMFERIYDSDVLAAERERGIATIRRLMEHYLEHPEQIPASYRDPGADDLTAAVDLVTGMTDRYALAQVAVLDAATGRRTRRPRGVG